MNFLKIINITKAKVTIMITKEQALKIAKQYLKDRKREYIYI